MKTKFYSLIIALLGLFCSVDAMAQVDGLAPVTNLQNGQYYIYCTTTQKWLNDVQNSTFTENPSTTWVLNGTASSYTLASMAGHTFSIYNSTENEPKISVGGSGISPVVTTYEVKTGNDIKLSSNINNDGLCTIYRANKAYPYTNALGKSKTDEANRNVKVNSNGVLSIGAQADQVWIFYTKADVDEMMRPKLSSAQANAYNQAMTTAGNCINNLGFTKGKYAPYNHRDAIVAYSNYSHSINAGDAYPCDEDNFDNFISTLSTWTPNGGDVEIVGNPLFDKEGEGWTKSGDKNVAKNHGFLTTGVISYGNVPGYTIHLEANTKYKLEFSYAAGAKTTSYSTNGVKVSVLNDSSEGLEKTPYTKIDGTYDENALVTESIIFTTGSEGNYIISLESDSKYTAGISSGTVFTNIHLNKVYPGTTVTAASHWGTFITEAAREEIPEGLEAYTVEGFEGDILTLAKATSIEANVPYLLKNTSKENDAEIPYVLNASGVKDAQNNGCLKGVYEKTTVPAGAFILYQPEGAAMGFYKVGDSYTAGNEPYVNANRCYLQIPETKAKAFRLEGIATAIEAAESLINGEMTEVYGVNGAKQGDLQKGMNIVRFANGKTAKILVK